MVAVFAFAGCQKGASPSAEALPNLVFITLDTTRADRLGCYGYFRETTPRLDEFAEQCVVFDECITVMATTLPTHVSLFTGTYPDEHGVFANVDHGGSRFQPTPLLQPFAEVCRQEGYQTAAFVSALPVKRGSSMEIGFDVYDEPEEMRRSSEETSNAVLSWLETRETTAPLLLWVHYFDAHAPYIAPKEYRRHFKSNDALREYLDERSFHPEARRKMSQKLEEAENVNNIYDGHVRYQDEHLGRLLDALQKPDSRATGILVIGDHGEGLCQHGVASHGGTWHEQLRAPFLMKVPGEAPRRVAEVVSVVDALPTFLGRLGLNRFDSFLEQVSGRDVLADQTGPGAVSQETGRQLGDPDYRRSLTTEDWKLIWVERPAQLPALQLFDRRKDPHELENLADSEPAIAHRLLEKLRTARSQHEARGRELRVGVDSPTESLTPEQLEQLKALGYGTDR